MGTIAPRRIARIVLVTSSILMVPLVATQFTDEVAWDLFDYTVAGALLGGAGLAYELAVAKSGNRAYKTTIAITVAIAVLLVWINLAVGIL